MVLINALYMKFPVFLIRVVDFNSSNHIYDSLAPPGIQGLLGYSAADFAMKFC